MDPVVADPIEEGIGPFLDLLSTIHTKRPGPAIAGRGKVMGWVVWVGVRVRVVIMGP